ncbi:carboxymuconolactone decarboxylase family protein [Azorhizophilus paspali]|uniref:Carboxymuconolactone decarboxylase family protein n=1 Tax=Azorhizophilus paspali TaxID=69963 RepID=A0ABV6SN52_AZOPA
MDEKERYDAGMQVRRAVLGDAHVDRSLITIAMLIGMNREGELKLHLRAARNNGVTRDEIKEVLMQSAIYCGIPAANATFHLAESVWDELGVESLA